MKITLPQKRELTRRFRKAIILSVLLLVILKAAWFIYCFVGYEEKEYSNSRQVLEVFENNEEQFTEFAKTLEETGIMKTLMADYLKSSSKFMPCPGDSLKNPKLQLKYERLLDGEQYDCIDEFFEDFGPAYVDGTVYYNIMFFTKDGAVRLYYVPQGNLLIFLSEEKRYGHEVTPICGKWYYCEY